MLLCLKESMYHFFNSKKDLLYASIQERISPKVVLFFDFLMRTLRLTHLSPFHLIAKFLLSSWNVTPKLCDEAPKRFALYLGLGISSFLTLFFLIELRTLATFIVIILFICAIFETVFDFCIGCKIYYATQIVSPWKK